MSKLKKLLKRYYPLFLLFLVEVILFFINYKKGTFLIGWDNLYPELNFKLAIKRNFFAIWQEYRGLGCIDGMSHAANLPQDIFRLFLSFLLPLSLIRWLYIILMHFLGGVGIYVLTVNYLLPKRKNQAINKFIALLAALFYQYNLGIIQTFFLPFEVFVVHFAFLPWLVYFFSQFLDQGKRKNLTQFFIFSILSIPQAHVPTLFIVYILALILIFLGKLIVSRGTFKKRILQRMLILAGVVFVVNAYWGLPFAYSTFQNSHIIANAKANQMTSNDIFYRNHKYGRFQDVATLKGFSLDFEHYDYKTGKNHFMMHPWLDHIKTPYFNIPAWGFFILAVLGLGVGIVRKRKKSLVFCFLFLISFILMGTDVLILASISQFLRRNMPLFQTVFRFTFTKFSVLYIFSYSIFVSLGVFFLLSLLRKKLVQKAVLLVSFISLFIYTLPSFQKHFFYENLAVPIPQDYFKSFKFFEKQANNVRVAILPVPWYWAWTQNKWGTIGSGFIWYGIPQPITDIAFAPWSDKNENFYWQLDQAIYSQDSQLLEGVLKKYDIEWIYFDQSVDNSSAPKMFYGEYEELLKKTNNIHLVEEYGFIQIYKYENQDKPNNFISIKNNLINIEPSYKYDNLDFAFIENGHYFSTQKLLVDSPSFIFYPFRSLFSNKSPADIEFLVEERINSFVFKSKLPQNLSGQYLYLPNIFKEEFQIFNESDLEQESYFTPEIYLDDQLLLSVENLESLDRTIIKLPQFTEANLLVVFKKDDFIQYDNLDDENFFNQENDACKKDPQGVAQLELENLNNQKAFKLTSVGSENCLKADLSKLAHRFGYLINVQATNLNSIRGLHFNIFNKSIDKSDIDTYFDHDAKFHNYYFIISPRNRYGLGYTFYFNNISEGREKTVNRLERIIVYKIPFNFLKSIKITSSLVGRDFYPFIKKEDFQVIKKNPGYYKVTVNNEQLLKNNPVLVLSQSYHPGWIAWQDKPFLGKRLDHILINNWANGWGIKNDQLSTIYLFFWPQLLEYLGFGLLVGFGAWLLRSRKK